MTLADVGYVGYGVEVSEGTLVAPTVFLPASSFSFDSTDDNQSPAQLRGSRDKYVTMPSPYSVSGTMDMELVSLGTRPLLKSALAVDTASVTTSAYSGGGYQTVFTPGSASTPTFTFESSAGGILVMRYGGIRVNTLEINAAFGEIVTASFGLEGTTRQKQGSETSESYSSILPFHFTGASIKRDSVAVGNVKNFTFNIGNNIERIGTLRATRDWKRTALGMRDVGLTCAMDFTDTTDYDLFLAGTDFSVDLLLEGEYIAGSSGPKHTLRIEIPRVRWNSVNAPLSAGDFIEQSVEATVLRPMNNDPILTMTIVSTESTAV
jgi:hypothetical protein